MPSSVVKSYAEKKGMSVEEAEKHWVHAKEQADKNEDLKKDSVGYWKYVTAIFKKMMGVE